MLGLAASDDRFDASLPDQASVLVVVVAAVGEQRLRSATRAATTTAHGWDAVEQFEQLGDVVAVGGGRRPGQRQPASVGQEVVLDALAAAVDRARAEAAAPFFAGT